jgi:hypothetical protein
MSFDFGTDEAAATVLQHRFSEGDAVVERARIVVEKERPTIAAPAVDVQHRRVPAVLTRKLTGSRRNVSATL